MSKTRMAPGLPSINQPGEICSGCLMSKQTRKPFPSQTNFIAKTKVELIHLDLCGPLCPSNPACNRYFMLLVDDYTRMMWVYMLKTKDEALTCFKKFKLLVENGEKHIIFEYCEPIVGGSFSPRISKISVMNMAY